MNKKKLWILPVLLALILFMQGIPVTAQADDENILIYYNFDGNVLDSSGNGNNGSIGGTATYVEGYSGQAISLDGNGWIALPQNMILDHTSFTVSMRFKTTSTGGLFGYQNTPAAQGIPNQFVPILCILPNGKLYAEMWTGTSMTVTSPAAVNDGNWHRVVMTSNESSIRVYLDGTDIGGQTGVPQHLSMSYNQIGVNAAWSRSSAGLPDVVGNWYYYTGLIDDFIFYSNAQSATEIAKETQTITFDALPVKTLESASFDLGATASSGLPVTYTSSNSSVATISGTTVTLHGVGTADITANQPGDATYSAAPQVVRTLTVIDTPSVTTAAPSALTAGSAVLGGNVTADGNDTVTERGVVYSSTDNTPTIGNPGVTKDINGSGTGDFSESVGSLTSDTHYYVRAYATNGAGTSYGSTEEFTTPTLSASISPASALTEENLDTNSIDVTLTGTTFLDSALDKANFTLNNAPQGLMTESVTYTDAEHCTVNLVFDQTDFDSDVTTFSLTIKAAELACGTDLTSGALTITATVEPTPEKTCPVVETSATYTQTTSGVQLSGTVVSNGSSPVYERGFIYGTGANPTIADVDVNRLPASGNADTFTVTLGDLASGVTYYARSYAISDGGISYGDVIVIMPSGNVGIPQTGAQTTFAGIVLCGFGCAGLLTMLYLNTRKRHIFATASERHKRNIKPYFADR